MTKFVNDSVMDAGLAHVSSNTSQLHICSGDPVDRNAALAASLANTPFVSADVTLADGDVSGRKNVYQPKTGISIAVSGTANTVCLISASELLVKTDLTTAQALTAGGTVDTPAFDHEIEDAA